MKQQITELLEEISLQMQQELSNKNFGNVGSLAGFLKKAESIQKRTLDIETEFSELHAELNGFNGAEPGSPTFHGSKTSQSTGRKNSGRAENKTLRVEIDWNANGKPMDKEVIALPMAADGMARCLARLIEVLGSDAIQKLARIRISRGPLISKSPEVDFANHKNGKIYNHKQIGDTEYYLLTNNDTPEKVETLKRVCNELGLVAGSVEITELNKSELLMEKYMNLGS